MLPRFPITDAALREMSRIERMKLKNARDVVRKGSTAIPLPEEVVPPEEPGGGPGEPGADGDGGNRELRAMRMGVDPDNPPSGVILIVGGSTAIALKLNMADYQQFPGDLLLRTRGRC